MGGTTETCGHPAGLCALTGARYLCPVCEARLDLTGVRRWVREAEKIRDEAHAARVDGVSNTEEQREVYRRRKALYEMEEIPHTVEARPEMILILYNSRGDCYECKIFYKEPRPAGILESLQAAADREEILELCSGIDPNVRLVGSKVREFHELRRDALKRGEQPLRRRVFYSNEL